MAIAISAVPTIGKILYRPVFEMIEPDTMDAIIKAPTSGKV